MDAITLTLPAGNAQGLRIVSIRGERQLQGFADTGVFRITAISREGMDDKPETDRLASPPRGDPHHRSSGRLVSRPLIIPTVTAQRYSRFSNRRASVCRLYSRRTTITWADK